MSNSKTVRVTSSGQVYMTDRKNEEHLLNPRIIKTETSKLQRNTDLKEETSLFRLVTVRKIEEKSKADVKQQLLDSRQRLSEASLRTNKAIPYPEEIDENSLSEQQLYAVYVDEDLKNTAPIYVYTSAVPFNKVFINAIGPNKTDWIVNIAYTSEINLDANGLKLYTWYLMQIKSDYSINYITNDDLDPSFKYLSLEYVNYTGGGIWSGLSVDRDDRIPIYGLAGDPTQYESIGQTYRYMGIGVSLSIIDYSFTPTCSFYWDGTNIKSFKRERSATKKNDFSVIKNTGVIELTHEYNYSLKQQVAPTVERIEYSQGFITYVANTNAPEVASNTITPDYGTDLARLAVKSYNIKANLLRPKTLQSEYVGLTNKYYFEQPNYLGILARDYTGNTFLKLEIGEYSGSINHDYDLKITTGQRGFQYGEFYKLWWCPGGIVDFRATNKGIIYRISKTTGDSIDTGKTLYDLGELKISDYPNAMITTWDSLPNPQTGYFGIETGELTWQMTYQNPPILGHQAIYYYEINPNYPGEDNRADYRDDAFATNMKNTLISVFSQMQGGLGGFSTTNSFYLGYKQLNKNASDTISARDPSPEQKATFRIDSALFPNGFWSDYRDDILTNENTLTLTTYDRLGAVVGAVP